MAGLGGGSGPDSSDLASGGEPIGESMSKQPESALNSVAEWFWILIIVSAWDPGSLGGGLLRAERVRLAVAVVVAVVAHAVVHFRLIGFVACKGKINHSAGKIIVDNKFSHADFTSLVSEDCGFWESDTCSSLALLTTPPARLAQRMRRRGARTRRVVYR